MRKRLTASEIDAIAEAHPIERHEVRERPVLRVRDDAPSVEVDTATPVGTILDRLGTNQRGGVVLRDGDGKAEAVLLSAERYAELAGCEIESDGRHSAYEVGLDRKWRPRKEVLADLMIEMVNPSEEWAPGTTIWRGPE